jgi:multidrug efflux pump subunit AcrA (membrane-fusion protein)
MTGNPHTSNETFLPPIQENEFLPPLGYWTRLGGLGIVGIVAIAIPLASVIQFKQTVRGQASIRPDGELRLVQAATAGPIIDIVAKENQPVKQGDVIASIDRSHLETKQNQLQTSIQQAQLQIGQVEAQISAQKILAMAEVEEAQADLRAIEATFQTAQAKRDRYQPIAEQGALPLNELEEAQLTVEQQAQAIEAAQARVQRARAAVEREEKSLIQQKIELSKQLEQSTYELRQVGNDLRHTTVTATSDGIISQLNLRNPGQTVSAGQEIAQIVPSHAPLQIKAVISPDDIDKIETGQTAQMRVSACPYPDFGVLEGNVTNISQDTIKPSVNRLEEMNSAAPAAGQNAIAPFYEVTIEPQSHELAQKNRRCSLQLGMEGQVDIVTREETVLRFLLRKARLLTDL